MMKRSAKKEVTHGVEVNHADRSDTHVTNRSCTHVTKAIMKLPKEIEERYIFSKYLLDPNKFRFSVVVRIMAIVIKFIRNMKMKIKPASHSTSTGFILSDVDIKCGEQYYYSKATREVKEFNDFNVYKKFSREKDGILWYTGRILPNDKISVVGNMTQNMIDLSADTFCVPVIDKYSPVAYSVVNEIHWNGLVKHSGVESVWRETLKKIYIIDGRGIVKMFKKSCERCRYLYKRSVDVAMGPISGFNTTIAPAFYITQVDLAGPVLAYSSFHRRTTVKLWMAVFCCSTTSTVSIKMMEDYSASAFVRAFIRLSCEVGYPKYLLSDAGSQLICGSVNMNFDFKDLKQQLHKDVKVILEVCPVGGHNMHGRVERKIREIKMSLEKNFQGMKFSVLQWETVVSEVSNSLNDMPLALGNITGDFECMDLLTPNRLRLGRNNSRSPDGILNCSTDPDKFLKQNVQIFNTWFEAWLTCHLPKLMLQPKWFKTSYHIKVGDVVLFLKNDSVLQSRYQYGVVKSVKVDRDNIIRRVNVEYRNNKESVNRETVRPVRELVVIHKIDELNIVQELGLIAFSADLKFKNDL